MVLTDLSYSALKAYQRQHRDHFPENLSLRVHRALSWLSKAEQARANKDFATSDKIRDELAAMGIQLKDGKEGTTFSIT